MKIIAIVVLVLIALIVYRLAGSSSKSKGGSVTTARRARAAGAAPASDQPFRSVSIKCGPEACDTAQSLGDRRFLTGKLGKLPLAGCDSSSCECRFEHHGDRRDSLEDKRAPTALRSELYTAAGNPERRSRRGRRKSDFH